MPKLLIAQARKAVQNVTEKPLVQDRLMIDEPECVTGMPIAKLAALTTKWLPR